ncbi:MAG: hypothetical protein GEV05_27810 [Betaproteobacteria bacterium]|nr:hypothetical protein [Betaproteobacteria bacterium]
MTTGRGVMAVWNDLEPGHEPAFESWYRRQHVPERLGVPGFQEARRYAALQGSPRYCAFYWLDSIAVLASPAYRSRLANPTAWTRRMMPRFRNMARTPCVVAIDKGAGCGGAMSWIAAIGRTEAQSAAPPDGLGEMFDACLRDPACVRLQLWTCDRSVASLDNPEARFRANHDVLADWIVCIETADEHSAAEHAGAMAARLRSEAPQLNLRAAPVYRLLWRMQATEAPAPCADEDGAVTAGA